MSISVTSDTRIAPGDTVTVSNPSDGIGYRIQDQPKATLTIGGSVAITFGSAYPGKTVNGLAPMNGTSPNHGFFGVVVETSGSLHVDGGIHTVNGLYDAQVVNHGLIEVTGTQDVTALGGTTYVENSGVIRATATAAEYGRAGGIGQGVNVSNTGSIEIFGTTGVAVTALRTLYNSGSIVAHTSGAAVAVSLGANVAADGFVNDGWIEGATALVSAHTGPNSINYVNRGTMIGFIDLSTGASRFTNSGDIDGQIRLSGQNDVYDGSSGRISGVIDAGLGADSIVGGAGSDWIAVRGGGDTVFAGASDDFVYAGGSHNRLDGGAGVDTLEYDVSTPAMTVDLEAGKAQRADAGAPDIVTGFERFYAGFGADVIYGSGGGETINAGLGDDKVFGRGGDDSLVGEGGRNVLRGDEGADTLVGGGDFDDLNGNVGDDSVAGGYGNDWVLGGKDNDRLVGEAGDDIMNGNLGSDTVDGGAGADIVRGGQGDDLMSGGEGADWLSGDRGDDTISGGAGADTFHAFQDAGVDRVTDFNTADGDRVQLDPGTSYVILQQDGDTIIDMGGGNRMILVGVQPSMLGPGWIFVG